MKMSSAVAQAALSLTMAVFFCCAAFAAIRAAVTEEPLMLIAGSAAMWVSWKIS